MATMSQLLQSDENKVMETPISASPNELGNDKYCGPDNMCNDENSLDDSLDDVNLSDEFTACELKDIVVNRINSVSRNLIVDGIRNQLLSISKKNEMLQEERDELEDDLAWSAELSNTATETTSSSFWNTSDKAERKQKKHFAQQVKSAAKLAAKQLEDSKIQEILLEKALISANLRISCALMEPTMITRQEHSISAAFFVPNNYLAQSAYYWNNGKLAKGLQYRSKAMIAEQGARKSYQKLVLDEALADALSSSDSAEISSNSSELMSSHNYNAWKHRILTDTSVVCETRGNLHACNGTTAAKVEAKWRHNRAKFILKADKIAFKAAWPLGDKAK